MRGDLLKEQETQRCLSWACPAGSHPPCHPPESWLCPLLLWTSGTWREGRLGAGKLSLPGEGTLWWSGGGRKESVLCALLFHGWLEGLVGTSLPEAISPAILVLLLLRAISRSGVSGRKTLLLLIHSRISPLLWAYHDTFSSFKYVKYVINFQCDMKSRENERFSPIVKPSLWRRRRRRRSESSQAFAHRTHGLLPEWEKIFGC